MSPVLDQIQEKVYERPIPYSPILGHSGFNRELLHAVLKDTLGESPLGKTPAVKEILDDWCDKHWKLRSDATLKIRDNAGRALHLGVIVRELTDKERYLLCLQPVCDSVRMGGESRAFVSCVLKEPEDGKRFTHCVMNGGGNMIKLEYKPKVVSVFVSNFKGNYDAVYADKNNTDDTNRLIFKDEDIKRYEWIAQLKTEHAQRAAEQFGREFSRVGLTESEWLRIKTK